MVRAIRWSPPCCVLLMALVLISCSSTVPDPSGSVSSAETATAVTVANPAPITPEAVFAGLGAFWAGEFPAAFGTAFVPLRGGEVPLDSGAAAGTALCISNPAQIQGNAYYCPDPDGIVYDTGVLIPVLVDHYGDVGLLSSLGHEYGHAVAARIGVATGPPLEREQQADCLAGAFLSWAVSDRAPFGVTDRVLVAAEAPLLDFGDQVGVKATDASAHGLAIDRALAVRLGSRDGPAACRDVAAADLPITLDRFPSDGARTPRFTSAADVESAALASLGGVVSGLPVASPSAPDVAVAAEFGQFALAAATVLAAAEAAGRSPTDAGCVVGRWTAGVFSPAGADGLGDRLSDPDEALNFVRHRAGASPELLAGFLDGFAARC